MISSIAIACGKVRKGSAEGPSRDQTGMYRAFSANLYRGKGL